MAYEKLFEKGKIGKMTLKNRGVMVPMATGLSDTDGFVTERLKRYYQERAKGGIGLIINEYTGVDHVDSVPSLHNLRASMDKHICGLEELTDAVHMYDCRIVAQLHHAGSTSRPALSGRDNLAPSAVPIAEGGPVPREMTIEDIHRIQGYFVDAAIRCRKAGYDGVELHGAHGYLIAQFFSKYYNRRTDEYGGSLQNRCRFTAEIIEMIRQELGDYPILLRMCGDEMTPVEGFLTLEDGIEIARHLEGFGLDAIDISNGSARNADANCEPFSYRSGWKKHVAKAYKEALSIPVIATNTIKDPDFAEALLQEGVCDFVGLGRSQLADPGFMNKAATGWQEEIRKCIGCLYCRERYIGKGLTIRCAINPKAAREVEFPHLKKDGGGRTVLVAGGGPCGMEAARILALRGFDVVLAEKEDSLGGTLNIADKPPLKDKITGLIGTMETQIRTLGVDIRTGTKVTTEFIRELSPCGVIVATGAYPIRPALPGADASNVFLAEDAIKALSMLDESQDSSSGDKVVVVGSGLTGLETAEMFLAKGCSVTVVEMLDEIGPGVFPPIRNDELSRLKGAELMAGRKLVSVEEGRVEIEDVSSGARSMLDADVVVLALGVRPGAAAESIISAFREEPAGSCGRNIRVCGDAAGSGTIATAIRQGFEAGYTFAG